MKWYEILTPIALIGVLLYIAFRKKNGTNRDVSGTNNVPEYFTLNDIHSRGTPPPPELVPNAKILLQQMNILQDELFKINPSYKLRFTSTYRSPEHNASIGGATKSKHMEAKAADFKVDNLDANSVQNLIVTIVLEGKMKNAGLGRGDTFTHYNFRDDGINSSWAYYHNGGSDTYGVSFGIKSILDNYEITAQTDAPAPTTETAEMQDLDI